MKFNKLFMGLFGALALTACSSEEVINTDKPNNGTISDESRFMSVTIRNTNVGTRAAGDQAGSTYEEGLDLENDVKNIRFYFFGENGKAFPVNNGKNYYDITDKIEEDGIDMPNVEQKFKAIIVLNAQEMDFSQLKSMVAVVNFDNTNLDESAKSLAELRKQVEDYSVNGAFNNKSTDIPKLLMTSAVFGTDQEYEGCEVYINPTKLKTTETAASADPVDVYVERVVAKVRMTAQWDNSVETKAVGNDILVALKDQTTGDYITTSNGKKIYAKFIGWGMQTFTDKSYLFKNIGGNYDLTSAPVWNNLTTWNTNLGTWWNDAANHRSYWALNPTDVNYKHAKHTDANGKIGTKLSKTEGNVTTTIEYDGDFFYTQENAADEATGFKAADGYDPNETISHRTQAYIRANLVDEDGNTIQLAEWGGQKMTEDGALESMWGIIKDQIHIVKFEQTTEEGDNQTTITTISEWKEIPKEMVHMVPAEDVKDKANTTAENSKRYLSYIQLGNNYKEKFPADYDVKFYKADNKTELSVDEVNAILAGMPGAKVWRGGETYYYTDLTHLMYDYTQTADKQPYLAKGAYGVVRNHIYEVVLNKIFGLGTPVLIPNQGGDEEKEIIPQKPTPDAFFLGARLNILSWRVVPNNTELNW